MIDADSQEIEAIAARLLDVVRAEQPPAGAHARALAAMMRGSPALRPQSAWRGSYGRGAGMFVAIGLIVGAMAWRSSAPALLPHARPERPPVALQPAPRAALPITVEPLAVPPIGAPTAVHARSPKPHEPSLGLREELRSLDAIRAALSASEPRTALALLAHHTRDFRHGALTPEAAVLRVQALAESGQSARAAALSRSFLRAHPESHYAAKLRAISAPESAP